MKKLGIGNRILAGLLAMIMLVSVIPSSVFAADGDISSGQTGLDTSLDTLDTISWPIKVYDYLNDGMLFEYATAQDSSLSDLDGDAYGGGEMMPGEIHVNGNILGNDYTVNSSSSDIYDWAAYSHWLKKISDYNASASKAQQGVGTAGAFKFLRLVPYVGTQSKPQDVPAIVVSDFANDKSYYSGNAGSYSKDRVRYAVVIYRTNVSGLKLSMGVSDTNGGSTVLDYNLKSATGPAGGYVKYDLSTAVTLTQDVAVWNYVVIDMSLGGTASKWKNGQQVKQIILDTNLNNNQQYLDLSHIAYFSNAAEAQRFAEKAVAFSNNPGEYLPDQSYTENGTTKYKHWNMGNNTAFTMLYASSGGGWQNSYTGGTNSWVNGYYSYQLGKHTANSSWANGVNSYRDTAKSKGYPVPDDIYFFSVSSKTSQDLSQYDFGYTLFNTITAENFAQVMTAGLLQNDQISVKGVDGKTYRIPEYKQSAVEYIALLLQNTLSIGQKDKFGNYNYNFVTGSASSQFADANGNKRDLASALREALGLKAAANNNGNYTGGTSGTYAQSKARQELLIGPYQQVIAAFKAKGLTFTYCDAAFYLMHNLFVDNSYNQLQDDYNYLVLSKATVSATGKEAYVFDAGFTTGNGTNDSQSAVQYNDKNGTISLNTTAGKDQIEYSGGQQTTRYPFMPVQDPEGDYRDDSAYNSNGTPYFEDDGAVSFTDYGSTYATRDYSYVMQANAEFVYHYQDDLFFQFQGDDDVYLFVNGELVMDIGAAHSVTSVIFYMNEYVLQAQKELSFLKQNYGYRPAVSDEKFEEILNEAVKNGDIKEADKASYRRWHHLNLEDGKRYPIDFYYMERHGWGANMRVATNILMTDPTMITDKKAYQDGAEIKYGGIVDPTKRIEYGFSLTNEGENKLYNLTFNDYAIGLTLSPEKGLSLMDESLNGVTVCDARGQKLEANDLVVWVEGYEDEEKTKPISLRIRFDGQDPNGELKAFLRDLTSNDGTDDDASENLYSGTGLWRHGTVIIRGIYYKLTAEQIADEQFNNAVFTTANPALDSDLVLNSADIHQVRLIGDARHIYQWREHDVHFSREDLVNWLGGSVRLNNKNYTASQVKITTCRKDGTTFDFADIIVRNNNQSMTVNYWDEGTQLFFIKVFVDTNNDGNPDDLNSDGKLNETDYMIVPLAVFVTDLKDDVIVLDYGLKAELTGKGGIVDNDYITVPNLHTGYSIMGLSQAEPSYLSDISNLTRANYNRISFAPVSGKSMAFSDGTYEYTTETNDDQLYFTPNNFMDEEYSLYMAVTVHELDRNPSAVGTANGTTAGYSIDITKEVQMYQKVTVLPASVMYYEDDFPGLIYASDIEAVTSGTGSNVLQQGVDQTENYGADLGYQTKDNAQFSGNSMRAVRVTKYGTVAQFTFKGTGFEVISRTNAFDSASFVVMVKKNGTTIRTLPVITEFNNADSSVCKHMNHNVNGHCTVCGTYVGHIYYQDVCSKCGQSRLDYYLIGYINGADYGCEGDYENMGHYKFVNGKLTATFKTDGYVFIKTTGNASYFMTDGYPGSNVTSAYLYNTTSPGLNADKLHVPGGVELTFTLVENVDGTLTLSYTTSNDDLTDFDKTVYFNNTDDWSQIYAYYWSNTDATMVDWPGVSMSRTEEGIYVMSLPSDAEYVIFNDGGSNQTMDLTVPAHNMVYSFSGFNKGWSVYNPGKTTLSFDNSVSKWGKVYIHYWSELDKQMVQWPGVEMEQGADNVYTAAIPSNATMVLFNNGNGSQTADLNVLENGDTYIYGTGWASQGSSDSVRTIYFQNTANWSNLHVYFWEQGSEGNLVAWPGDAMTVQDGNIYKASIPVSATHVIFNNGSDAAQTLNLELQENMNLFVYDRAAAETVPTGSWSMYGTLDIPEEPEVVTSRTVYLINTSNWTNPYAHYWVDGGVSTAWPGVKMTKVEGNLYSVTVALETDYIIFNNGSGTQTGNLPLVDGLDTYHYQQGTWSSAETKTIYLENNTGWATPFAYFWFGDNSQMLSVWPGVQMTKVEGNRYSVTIPAIATKIIFNNGSGTQTDDLVLTAGSDLYNLGTGIWSSTGTQEATPITTRGVYYDNNKGWEKVYVYYWSLSNENMIDWPGVEMTADENGIYGAQIPSDARYVIFNDFAGSQTADLTVPTNANFYSVPVPNCGTWEQFEAKRVLYFNAGTSGWTQVNAYYWSETNKQMVSWPGEAMTHVSGTLFSITVPYSAEKVIFNDGTGNQTVDLNITDACDRYDYDTGLWSNTTRVIYFEDSGTGSVRLTYSGDGIAETRKIMSRIRNGIYSCVIPVGAKYVTFEDGEIVHGPVILSDDHDLYTNDNWAVFDPAADYRSTIYFKNTQGWEDVYIHYWGDNVNATTWPGVPMTFVDDRIYTINIPKGVAGVVFNNGKSDGNIQTGDWIVPDGKDLFTINANDNDGSWSKYVKAKNDAIHQVPALRVDGLELGEYTVEIQGMPTYTDDVDWSDLNNLASYVKTTYLYIDGIRIYQPLGKNHENYLRAENGATVKELRNLILEGHAAVAAYDHGTTTYTGNVSWTENRNGTGADMETVYMGNQLSGIDDYLLLGPNNETYLSGNAQTQAVIFYVKETDAKYHALQIAARGIDAGLFLGSTSSGVNATLYHGVFIENPDDTIGYGWRPIDTVLSGTEQYYTVKYQDCPYLLDEDGEKVYQVALFVRSGMISFTNVKFLGLDLQSHPVGDATELQMYNGTIYVENEESGVIGGSQSSQNKIGNNLISISAQMTATQWIQEQKQDIVLKYPALSFEDEIYYNVFFTMPEMAQQPVEMGLLIFDTLEEDGTIYDAAEVVSGVTMIDGMYVARSQGVQAKDLGETLYFRVFAQMADGTYVYSKTASYSVRQYAKAVLSGNYSLETKALIAAMLQYSEAARMQFGGVWTLSDLITEDVSALITDYSADLLAKAAKPDATKAGSFAATATGFAKKAPAVSFDGAFAINYFFTPSAAVQGDMTMYYWNAQDYDNAQELTAENATGSMVMTSGDRYSAAITGIAAKDLDSTYYVAVVYHSNGQTYCSGVLAYSLATYCNSKANAEGTISDLAKATAVYGYHAKQLFG